MRALLPVLAIALCPGCLRQQVDAPVAAQGGGAAAAAFGARLHLVPGEQGAYSLHLHDVLIGRGSLQVSPIVEGRARVTTVFESDGIVDVVVHLRDEVSTVLDLAAARPAFTRGGFVNLLTGGDAPEPDVDSPWDKLDHNGHSLLLALRAWEAPPGSRAVAGLWSRGKVHTTDVWYVGHEVLDTALGPLPAVRVEGSIADASSRGEPFHFVLWCADDETRAILRLDTDTDIGQIASARIVAYSLE
jgi:hypothetical protein